MSEQLKNKSEPVVFTWGDPSPVMDGRDITEYMHSWHNGNYYEPPVSPRGLAKTFRANPHHTSAILVKRNILAKCFNPHKLLSRKNFTAFCQDYLIFGNSYLESIESRTGKKLPLKPALAKYTRRKTTEENQYCFVSTHGQIHDFAEDSIFHLMSPDINQEIYGTPEYLAGLNSVWLNESATIFRRKYYENGAHAGHIIYINDAAYQESDIDDIRESLKNAKGDSNFKNLFLYSPNGKKDGIQIIPLSEVQAKDEFFNIKNVSRDDILTAHRVPPQLMGVVPTNTAGFGDAKAAAEIFNMNEIEPLKSQFLELNEWFSDEIIVFSEYEIPSTSGNASDSGKK